MKAYKILNVDFNMDELTLEEMELVIGLFSSVNILPEANTTNVFGAFINSIPKMIGAIGNSGLLSKLLSIILKRKDNGNTEEPAFFLKAKRSEVMEVLKDFLSGEGKSIFTGIKDLIPSLKENLTPKQKQKD